MPHVSRPLASDEQAEYDKLVATLLSLRVLTVADGLALELAAAALAEYWRVQAVLREQGLTYETTTHTGSLMIRQRVEVTVAADAWRRAHAGLTHLGLTPSSRTKVAAFPPPPRSKWDGLLGDAR